MSGQPICAFASLRSLLVLFALGSAPALADQSAPPSSDNRVLTAIPAAPGSDRQLSASPRLTEALAPASSFTIGEALHPEPGEQQGPISLMTFAAMAPTGGPYAAWDELGRLLLLEFTEAPEAWETPITAASRSVSAVRARLTTSSGTAHVLGLLTPRPTDTAPGTELGAAGTWVFIPIVHFEELARQTGLPPELLGLDVPPGETLCALAGKCAAHPDFDPCTDSDALQATDALHACLARAGKFYGAAIELIESFNDEGLTLCFELESDWLRARCVDGVTLWSEKSLVLTTRAFTNAIHACYEAYKAALAEVVDDACR